MIVINGQRTPTTGWFVDGHGHRLFVRKGDLAPVCPWFTTGLSRWRLVQELPAPDDD